MVFAADLITKWWVKSTLFWHDYPVIEGFFTIQYAENTGIAFGLFDDVQSQWKGPALCLLAIGALCMVLYYIWTTSPNQSLVLVALGLVLGGILGNFVDRLIRGFVVDFVKLHWRGIWAWPTFNIADSAITIGVFLMLAISFLGEGNESATDQSTVRE